MQELQSQESGQAASFEFRPKVLDRYQSSAGVGRVVFKRSGYLGRFTRI